MGFPVSSTDNLRCLYSNVKVDHSLPAKEIGPLLQRLVLQQHREQMVPDEPEVRTRVKAELAIAVEGGAFQKGIMEMGTLTPFTCPECHGVLVKLVEDDMTRYRCHTGHAYSASALLEGVMQSTGEMLWQVMRSLEEAVMLLEHMGTHIKEQQGAKLSERYFHKARDLESRSKAFHDQVLKHESLSGENLRKR